MQFIRIVAVFSILVLAAEFSHGQKRTKSPQDTLFVKNDTIIGKGHINKEVAKKDSSIYPKGGNPHKASLYSAILPGAGQFYNKKYWKIPIVYAALGATGWYYFYNRTWYRKAQYALTVTINGSVGDSLKAVDPYYLPWVNAGYSNYIINDRNSYRRDEDYSVLYFLIFWGLNIVDATVDAHLKGFNVNSDLSFKVKPYWNPGSTMPGLSLVFDLHKGKNKLIDLQN